MNAVIYARYSSSSQRDESIEGQLRDCHAFANANGYTVIAEYSDAAMTGRNDDRPQFQKMIKDSEQRLFQAVIVWKIDRFSRNRYNAAVYKKVLEKNGVKLLYAKEAIPDDPTGIILEALMEGMAEYYSANLAQNIKRGNYDSVLKGSALGHQVYGYDIGEDHCYHVNETEAQTVRRIFAEYASGKRAKDILADLQNDGIRNKKGQPFNHNFISKLIGNEKYKGIYRYHDITVPVDRIVPDELWEEANAVMNKHRISPGAKEEFLLSGKIVCGECGKNFIGTSGKSHTGSTYYYYGCVNALKYKSCSMPRLIKTDIEQRVVAKIRECLSNEVWVAQIAADCEDLQNREGNPELDALLARKKTAQTALGNLVAALELTSDPAVIERITQRRAEIADLDAAIIEQEKTDIRITAEQITLFLHHLGDGDTSDPEYCRRLINTFVNRLVVYKDRPPVLVLNATGDKATITLDEVPDGSAFDKSGLPIVLKTNLFVVEL